MNDSVVAAAAKAPSSEGPAVDALADAIAAHANALNGRVLSEMYANPFWAARFGDRGKVHARQDGAHHLSYLVEALRAGAAGSGIVKTYAVWLRSVLVARGMCTRHLDENFARLAQAIADVAAEAAGRGDRAFDKSERATALLEDARGALRYAGGPGREVQTAAAAWIDTALERLVGEAPEAAPDARARERCRDDLAYHVDYLADALAANRPELFEAYARFIAGFLDEHGVPRTHVDRAWVILGETMPRVPSSAVTAIGVVGAAPLVHLSSATRALASECFAAARHESASSPTAASKAGPRERV